MKTTKIVDPNNQWFYTDGTPRDILTDKHRQHAAQIPNTQTTNQQQYISYHQGGFAEFYNAWFVWNKYLEIKDATKIVGHNEHYDQHE